MEGRSPPPSQGVKRQLKRQLHALMGEDINFIIQWHRSPSPLSSYPLAPSSKHVAPRTLKPPFVTACLPPTPHSQGLQHVFQQPLPPLLTSFDQHLRFMPPSCTLSYIIGETPSGADLTQQFLFSIPVFRLFLLAGKDK